MYICYDCLAVFEQPMKYTETHGLSDGPYEHLDGCPECGGAYCVARCCDECGKLISGEYVKIGNLRFCDKCYCLMEIGDEDDGCNSD